MVDITRLRNQYLISWTLIMVAIVYSHSFTITTISASDDGRQDVVKERSYPYVNQDDSRLKQLELYLKTQMEMQNKYNEHDGVNLAQLNDRASSREQVVENIQYISPISNSNKRQQFVTNHEAPSHDKQSIANRRSSDQRVTFVDHQHNHEQQYHDQALDRKAKFTHDLKTHIKGPLLQKENFIKNQLTMNPLVNKAHFYLDLKQNCITRSTPKISYCEDHLIRRLSQDATEGRTVIDVGRRVCCALFWHKDCISRVVLETCPDSSPAAADYLLGTSRKLDLTMSCQMFTRDGCNSSHLVNPNSILLIGGLIFIYFTSQGNVVFVNIEFFYVT